MRDHRDHTVVVSWHCRRTTPPGSEMGYVSATDEVPHVPLVSRAGRCIVRSAMAHRGETRVHGLCRRRAAPWGSRSVSHVRLWAQSGAQRIRRPDEGMLGFVAEWCCVWSRMLHQELHSIYHLDEGTFIKVVKVFGPQACSSCHAEYTSRTALRSRGCRRECRPGQASPSPTHCLPATSAPGPRPIRPVPIVRVWCVADDADRHARDIADGHRDGRLLLRGIRRAAAQLCRLVQAVATMPTKCCNSAPVSPPRR
jgi:hypothetical protein